MYPGGTIVHCDSLMVNGGNGQTTSEAAYYQMESPPCYTIATGLPTYDEALHHQHQHYSYSMKFIYPTIAAVHHHPMLAGNATGLTNWEKEDLTHKYKEQQQQLQQCKQKEQQQLIEEQQQFYKQKPHKATTTASATIRTTTTNAMAYDEEAPPAYDVAASVALLGEINEKTEAISIPMIDDDDDYDDDDNDVHMVEVLAAAKAATTRRAAIANSKLADSCSSVVVVA